MKTDLFVVIDKETQEVWYKPNDYRYSGDFGTCSLEDINKECIYYKITAEKFKKLLELEIGDQFTFEIKQLNISL